MKSRFMLGLTAMLAMFVGSAQAALSTEATAGLASITGAVTDMEAGVWPIVALSVVALIGIKLFKRFANKV